MGERGEVGELMTKGVMALSAVGVPVGVVFRLQDDNSRVMSRIMLITPFTLHER